MSYLSDAEIDKLESGGTQYLSDADIAALESSSNKRNTSIFEDFKVGLNSAAQPVAKWAGMVAGAVPSYLGDTETADSIYKKTDELTKSMEDYWVPKDAEQKTFAGKAIGTVASLPQQLLAFPFSPAETGKTLVDAGEDGSWNGNVQGAAMLDTLGNTAGVALPGAVGGGLLKKFVSGAAINAGQETFMKKAIQNTATTEKGKAAFEPTLEGAGLAAIVGGPMGMLTPNAPKTLSDTRNPYIDKRIDTKAPEVEAKAMTDVDNQIDVRRSEIKRIEEHIARQSDPTSEHTQKLHADLLSETQALTQLLAFKGEHVAPDVPRTDVEAPRIDEQNQSNTNTPELELGKPIDVSWKSGKYDFSEQRTYEHREDDGRLSKTIVEEDGTTKKYWLVETADGDFIWKEAAGNKEGYARLSKEQALEWAKDDLPAGQQTPPKKQTFEPLPDRYSVNDAVTNRDYSTFSPEALSNMMQNKQKKIDAVYESILKHGVGSEAGMKALAFKDLLQKEYDLINKEFNKKLDMQSKSEHDFIQVAEQKASWELREPMLQALRERGIRGGLEVIAAARGQKELSPFGRYLGELAQKLLDNPLVGQHKYVEDTNFEHAGGFDNVSGYVHMKGDWTSSPGVFLHEVVHSAVNRALSLFDRGLLTDPKQVLATRNIKDLYNKIKLDKGMQDILKRFVGDDYKIYMENTREFVAYGLSDQKFQLALNKIKLGDTPVFSRLTNAIKNLLNLNKNERTALDDVLRYGEHLIDASEGLPPGFNPNEKVSYHKLHTPQDLLAALKSGALHVFAHGFTQNMRQMMRHDVHFSAVEEKVAKAERAKEYLVRTINHGIDAIPVWKEEGKYWYKTTGSEQEAALVPSMFNLKGVHIFDVYDTLMNGYRNSVDALDTIKENTGKWSKDQLMLAHAINNATTKLYESSIKMLASKGLDYTKLKQRIGYMLTSRVGNHAMTVKVNGILVRQQHFLTQGEAKHWADIYKKQNNDSRVVVETAEVSDLREGNATQGLKDFLETLSTKSGKELEEYISQVDRMMNEDNSNIGSHTLKSHIVGGYIGNQIGMSKNAMGEQLRTALPKMVDNYAQNIMSRSIQKDYLSYLIDNEDKINPTTKDLIGFYIETQIGQPFQKGGVSEAMKMTSDRMREWIDTGVDSIFGYHNRDKHAIDRFMGLFGNAFYISNILMKPSIWLAQPLQALNSLRSSFKEGETPRQVLMSFGETLVQLSMGKKYIEGNPELEKAIYRASQETNVLHPQMVNDYNDMRIGSNPNSWLNSTIDTISGKKISAWGDRGSRYASFLFFYNLHKRSGLVGDELIRVASRDATENMVAYGSKKLPAIYREMGIVGEQGATLATFAHAQLGNLIVDLKEFATKPGARTAAPLIMTAAVTMILGGAISMPIIAEYELLRQMAVSMGWWTSDRWPSASELIMDHAPRWVSMGLLSDVTDIDMDASMRYTSLLNKIVDIEKNGLLAFSPHLSWGKDVVANAWDAVSPNSTVPQRDQALKKVLPKGPVSGIVDQARNDWDLVTGEGMPFTRTGPRGQGGVPRDTAAKIAPFIGSQPTTQSMDMKKQLAGRERDKQAEALTEKAIQYLVHGDKERGVKAFDKLLTQYYAGDQNKLNNGIENQIAKMNSTGLFGRYWNAKTGASTPAQQAAIIRDNLGEYLKRRNGK